MKGPSFLALPKPIITCITGEKTVEADIANIKNAEYDGAQAFAVHLERLGQDKHTAENLKRLSDCTAKPVMFLHYRDLNARPKVYTDEERVELLHLALKCGGACTDITADTFDASACEFTKNQSAIDKQRRFIDEAHAMGAEVVMSSHIMEPRSCEQVLEQMTEIEKRGPDFSKIVTIANTEAEFLEAIKTTLELRKVMKKPFIHLCSGQFAKPQRLLGPALGSALTFCTQKITPDYITMQPPVVNMIAALKNLNWSIDDVKTE